MNQRQELPSAVTRPARFDVRKVATAAHRYVGLAITVFLVVAGLTGSVLAFFHEIDAWWNPELWHAEAPSEDAKMLDPLALRERLVEQLPEGSAVNMVKLKQTPGQAQNVYITLPESSSVKDNDFFVNPYTGELQGSRKFGDLSQGSKNLIPFLYKLHYSLGLGRVGITLFGIAALLWTLDCFVGAYLTFPPRSRTQRQRLSLKRWSARWARSWLLKTTKWYAAVFTWHRASGLWLWGVLLCFAWSAVALNLRKEVYRPLMSMVMPFDQSVYTRLKLDTPLETPKVQWEESLKQSRKHLATLASEQNFEVYEEDRLRYIPSLGHYELRVHSSLDLSTYARTSIFLNGTTGELGDFHSPTGAALGNTVTEWLLAIHFGAIRALGVGYRVFVATFGVVLAVLALTGVTIWWRKWTRRRSARA